MNENNIGKTIKKLRKDNNMSQEELANLLNCNNTSISKWENGIGNPDIYYLKKISNIFNIDLNDLLEGNNITKKIPKTHLIYLLIIIIETVLLIICMIKLTTNKDISTNQINTLELISSNKEIEINGKLIIDDDYYYLDINNFIINNIYTGTEEKIIPKIVSINILVDEVSIVRKEINNSDNEELSDILKSLSISKEGNKKINLDNIKIIIEYFYKNNSIDIIIPIKTKNK